jgi:hypothetical protein
MDDSIIINEIRDLYNKVKKHKYSYIFLQPIEEIIDSCPKYMEICKRPIDLNKIEKKIYDNYFKNIEDLKYDIDLMFDNCKTFNANNTGSWILKGCAGIEEFFNNNYKKSFQKIDKYKEKVAQAYAHKSSKHREESAYSNQQEANMQNFQVINNNDDERITRKIKNLFTKISEALNIKEDKINEIIAIIVEKIVKRNKSFEQIYDDTMKFLSKNISNDSIKSYFSKKFRKLLRGIKEEQNDIDNKAFNIKIDLNENEEKREEKDKLEIIRKEISAFIDNQKMPEVFRQNTEYPIE